MFDVRRAMVSMQRHAKYAQKAVDTLDVELRLNARDDMPPDDEEDTTSLTYHARQIYRYLLTAFYALNLPQVADELRREFTHHENKLAELRFEPSIAELVSDPLSLLESYIALLYPYLPQNYKGDEQAELSWNLSLLTRILRGTPKMIYDRRLEPRNESDVKKAIYDTLIHSFPDTTGEFTLPKPIRSFRPDFGIPGLKAAIEYKFGDSEAEVKTIIGGLFEDMIGYSGTTDWQRFYAVIYMTKSFVTESQVLSNFGTTKLKEPWTIITVTGDGKRRITLKSRKGRSTKQRKVRK